MQIKNNILNSLFQENELISISSDFSAKERLVGEGKKEILILIPESEATQTNLDLLSKILKAIKVDLEKDVFVLKIKPTDRLNVQTIGRDSKFNQIFIFAENAHQLGFNITEKKYQELAWNGYRILLSDGLEKINSQDALKRALWAVLKTWEINT